MANISIKKLIKEYNEIKKSDNILFTAKPRVTKSITPQGTIEETEDYQTWDVIIKGPEETPYKGGIFHLSLEFPSTYPFKPPVAKFITKIFHPNIHDTGIICLDILKNNWSPVLNTEKLLMSLISLLAEPNANDPLNQEAGNMYRINKALFDKKAKEMTLQYAK